MSRRGSLHAIVVAALAAGLLACLLATWPAQAAKERAKGQDVERRIDSLLRRMTWRRSSTSSRCSPTAR